MCQAVLLIVLLGVVSPPAWAQVPPPTYDEALSTTEPTLRYKLFEKVLQTAKSADRARARLRLIEMYLLEKEKRKAVKLFRDLDYSVLDRDDKNIARQLQLRFGNR